MSQSINQSSLKLNVAKFTGGSGSIIKLVTVMDNAKKNLTYYNYNVSAAYDQGSIFGKVIKPSDLLTLSNFPNKIAQYIVDNPILVASELAIIPVSWFVLKWWIGKRQRVHMYYAKTNMLYNDGRLNENDIYSLDQLKYDLRDTYANGKIRERDYKLLNDNISLLYEEIYKKKIDSLWREGKNSNLGRVKDDINDAYVKEKISEQQYNILNDMISARYEEFYNKTIVSVIKEGGDTLPRLDEVLVDMVNAAARGMLNKQHFMNLKHTFSIAYEEIYRKMIYSLNAKNTNDRPLDKVKQNIRSAYVTDRLEEQHYNLLIEEISESRNNQESANKTAPSSSGSPIRSPIKN